MQIEVHNPVGYDAERMAAKFIRALYGESMEEFAARIAKARERSGLPVDEAVRD